METTSSNEVHKTLKFNYYLPKKGRRDRCDPAPSLKFNLDFIWTMTGSRMPANLVDGHHGRGVWFQQLHFHIDLVK